MNVQAIPSTLAEVPFPWPIFTFDSVLPFKALIDPWPSGLASPEQLTEAEAQVLAASVLADWEGHHIPGSGPVRTRTGEWGVKIDQDAWMSQFTRQIPPYPETALGYWTPQSIDRERKCILLSKTHHDRAKRVALREVLKDFINLRLEHDIGEATAQEKRLEQLRKQLDAFPESLIESLDPRFLNLNMEARVLELELRPTQGVRPGDPSAGFGDSEMWKSCTESDRKLITGFVERYGFPFVPYEELLIAVLHPESIPFFDAFKTYHYEFMLVYGKYERGQPYNNDDAMLLRSWINRTWRSDLVENEASLPDLGGTTTVWSLVPRCHFGTLASILGQANRLTRNQGLGTLSHEFTQCGNCGRVVTADSRWKYPQFPHCSETACQRWARSEVLRYRRANEPQYAEKQRELGRARSKHFRDNPSRASGTTEAS